ncbi:hypothetical protein MOQ72_28785 [Saccharopolyspora sp. K220]|uniref:hypothetical protein n=1 Tax=Saccharopolyspora soli TaxID=2926618 RepID=UPI001F58348F|nr:hypothetical protein [Saccharopolyspora soli]MCI2421437.1 hypothetical protein [Saccharopolyspora soli]
MLTQAGRTLVFSALWCPVRRVVSPERNDVAGRQQSTPRIAEVSIDDIPGLAQRFNVQSRHAAPLLRQLDRTIHVRRPGELTECRPEHKNTSEPSQPKAADSPIIQRQRRKVSR